MTSENTINPLEERAFVLYTSSDGAIKLDVFLVDEMIWLSQKMMAELFDVDIATINYHIKEVLKTYEIDEKRAIRKFLIVQNEGSRRIERDTQFYNLDMIIAVGYRVNGSRAIQFRIWATSVLKEYIIKGFVLDDERLKQGQKVFNKDYFRELLDKIRSIRSSERRIYLQITDIFSECSIDYNPQSDETKAFFSTIQNKFHYAITGKTAAEIIYTEADRSKPHMGLTVWKHSPDGRVLQSDVVVAKNYLSLDDIKRLERTISSFFDYIERIIESHKTFTMKEFRESIDKFLSFNDYKILDNKGSISMKQAEQKALDEYDIFNKTQKIVSDFEKHMKGLGGRETSTDR